MKTIKFTLLTSTVLLLLIFTGCIECFDIRGNGIERTETRYANSFNYIKSSGAFEVHVSYGDEYEVVVNAESNILPYIETNVRGNSLDINIEGIHNVRNTLPMKVYITTPVLVGLKESGSGLITTGFFESTNFDLSISGSGTVETAVECHNLEANISGSGRVYLSGVADYAEYRISGSGRVEAYDLVAKDCYATVSGSGDIYTNVERNLNVTISGSGNVFYIGNPSISKHISGSGKIINDN